MRNFSLPPYKIGEMAIAVKRIGELTGVDVSIKIDSLTGKPISPNTTTVSGNCALIGNKYNIPITVSHTFSIIGTELQKLIDALVSLGVIKYEDL